MAYDLETRAKCRAMFEVLDMTLKDISNQMNIPNSTLSVWKNDDSLEFGGAWTKGSKKEKVKQAEEKLVEELRNTAVYDEIKEQTKTELISTTDDINKHIQATAETDMAMMSALSLNWFNSQMVKNAVLSQQQIDLVHTLDPKKLRQADIKISSEIIKMAKESVYGKTPDIVVMPTNGEYSKEDYENMNIEQLEELIKN
jgi:hypothetical protein